MKRIFIVSKKGIVMQERESIEQETREEERRFLSKVRDEKWFQDLLKRLCITEEQWIENVVDTRYILLIKAIFKKNPSLK